MKFGPLPVREALGTILAHGTDIEGRRLKKGHVLTGEDLEALARAGHAELVVARLDAGDMAEDPAAAALAGMLAGPGVRIATAFTGRANLFAEADGVLVLDAAAITQANGLDEAATVATLPDFARVSAGAMVGTIKIIPLALPSSVAEDWRQVLATGPAIRVAPFRPRTAVLIQTVLPGLKRSVLASTERRTEDRLATLGSSLVAASHCTHDSPALVEAIRAAPDSDLILIAGASAIIDRRDVIPSAIEALGGQVERLGMPVDPGNLLLLGRIGERRVLGLPGCARSPKPNGFDWVLQRLCADLPVGSMEIAAMGVGGLLEEIPVRPQSRLGRPARIGAVLLAAGLASRMGRDKLMMSVNGVPMLTRAVDLLAAGSLNPIVAVVGQDQVERQAVLAGRPVRMVLNPDPRAGLGHSLALGLAALPNDLDGVLVALGDMPLLGSTHLDRLLSGYDGRTIRVPRHAGRRGNPVLWPRRHLAALGRLTGDRGGRDLLQAYAEDVEMVEMDDDAILTDIDTPEDYAALAGPLADDAP